MIKKVALSILLLLLPLPSIFSWGFWAHQRINYHAVINLPEPMRSAFLPYIDHLSIHSVDPDKRRRCDMDEAVRHFIDLDRYGDYPYSEVPRNWNNAIAKYGEHKVLENGIVPWVIQWKYQDLVKALTAQNAEQTLAIMADLGHYIGDAHVPFHTTENYDGQLSDQKGIHALWESLVPQQFGHTYQYEVKPAVYIKNIETHVWDAILASNQLVDSALDLESKISKQMGAGKYCIDKGPRSAKFDKKYSCAFIANYNKALSDMALRRMRTSIYSLACIYYSAYVDAGQPNLAFLSNVDPEFLKDKGDEESFSD